MSKPRIVIRMGAGVHTAVVRVGDNVMLYDFNRMPKAARHNFRRALVTAFKETKKA